MKRFWLVLCFIGLIALLSSCSGTRMLMQTAPNTPRGASATPAIIVESVKDWESQKAAIFESLETHIYGKVPSDLNFRLINSNVISGDHFDASAKLETHRFLVSRDAGKIEREFGLVIVTPAHTNAAVPLLIMQNFCPNHDVIPHPDIPKPDGDYFSCSGGGVLGSVFTYFFGRYITSPPVKNIMNREYALAVMYPTEFVPDNSETGPTVLDALFPDQPQETRTGAIAAWAAQFSAVSQYLRSDPRFTHHITYGHSRFGKSALLAAAYDPNIAGVVSHQSGTGGASLSRDKPGETVADITNAYPYWFNKTYAQYSGREDDLPVDQHHLLAQIAPRPVLLGNAKRDVWSDPSGGFRAAIGATPVYKLYGSDGLQQKKLTSFNPDSDLAFWMRPGTHGVVKEDWPAFLDFLDAHFK